MNINYESRGISVLYQYELSNRHFQAAFLKEKNIQQAFDQHILQTPDIKEISWGQRVKHFLIGVVEALPIIGLIAAVFDRIVNRKEKPVKESSSSESEAMETPIVTRRATTRKRLPIRENLRQVVNATPQFASYGFGVDTKVHLTDLSVRPMNLFHEALFGRSDRTTLPGGELFRYTIPNEDVRHHIMTMDDDQVIEFSAQGKQATLYQRGGRKLNNAGTVELETYLGDATFRISARELKRTLESQRVHITPLISKQFYLLLKRALYQDNVVVLPGNERDMYTMQRLLGSDAHPNTKQFLEIVRANPTGYGFVDDGKMLSFDQLMGLTLYQLGSMVFKTEDYHSFVGNGLKVREREVGARDEINLISACGIRGFGTRETRQVAGNTKHEMDRLIMKETFRGSLQAAEHGYAVFPAVGMGVWGGDPDVYWRAFLDAVLDSDDMLEHIFVNPGHQVTRYGKYKNSKGEEFEKILNEYRAKNPDNPRLKKIVNLYGEKTDLLLLAQNLKTQNPDKRVSLFNASDPDVTLGAHVTEYANNLCHASTTEENYACAGTSSLGFEKITGVIDDPERVLTVS